MLHTGKGAMFKDASNTLRFPPGVRVPGAKSSRVVFDSFHVFCRAMCPGSPGSPLAGSVSRVRGLGLGCVRGAFSVQMSSVGCSCPSSVLCA